jgi:hypothetical protein
MTETGQTHPVAGLATGAPVAEHRVRVWFGQHVVAEYVAAAQFAEEYAEAIGRRYAGLRVTVETQLGQPGVSPTPVTSQPLPSRRLWELTPF